MDEQGWLTTVEAARHSGFSRKTVDRGARKGELPFARLRSMSFAGRGLRVFRVEDVDAWAATKRGAS
jgi:excisionase family DNA binding protein